jgi:hypothetical protein
MTEPIYYFRTRRLRQNGKWSKWSEWRIIHPDGAPSQLRGCVTVRICFEFAQTEYTKTATF